jgi:hypothetical protein
MQIKIDKFLALTAMMASTQMATVSCVQQADDDDDAIADEESDDGNSDAPIEPTSDAGKPATTPSAEPDASGPTTPEPVEDAAPPTPELDSGIDAGMSDAGGPLGDAASETDWSSDAATDAGWDSGDPGDEVTVPECFGGDSPDSASLENCFQFDSCFELGFSGASDVCYDMNSRYRAGVFDAFWDCYLDAGVEDPCSENADLTASSCASFAIEGACIDEVPRCADVTLLCSSVTVDDCNSALAPHNSAYGDVVIDCAAFNAGLEVGPDYEGCSTDFYNCLFDPSFE